MRLGLRSAMTAVFLWVMVLFLVRHQTVVALLAAVFLALNVGLPLVAVWQRP